MVTDKKNQRFLFVNKSKSSAHLSQSQADEKSAIQRHVQTGRKRSRRSDRSGTPAYRQYADLAPSPDLTYRLRNNKDSRPLDSQIIPLPEVSQHACESEESDTTVSDHLDAMPRAEYDLTSLISQGVLAKQDPFNASSVLLDKRVAGLLHYYMYYYHPSQWPNEVALLRKGVYLFHGTVLRIIRTAIADKLAMYCLLAASASRLQFVDRLSCPLVAGSESHYMRLALQLMTPYISHADFSKPDEMARGLACIGLLASAEAYRGNTAGCRTHFSAQVRLVNMKGGLAQVKDKYMQGHLAMGDLFLACVSLQPCMLDCSYDPGPAQTLKLLEHEYKQFPTVGISNALLNNLDGLIPSELEAVIEELCESHNVKTETLLGSMSATRATQVTHWITLRNMAIRHKLLALDLVDPRSQSLRIAVIMWSLYAMNITGRAKTVRMMASQLKQSLSVIEVSKWGNNQHIHLWIILIGLYCADEDSEEAAWLWMEYGSNAVAKTLSDSASTAIHLAQKLEEFQRGFLFDDTAQRSSTYKLAETFLLAQW